MKACAKPPKPPRVTWPEPESDGVPDGAWFDEEPALEKWLRDDEEP